MEKKRLFDLAVAFPAFFLLSPLFLLTALAVRLETPGAPFFRQERVGRDGRLFRMVKFRSMRSNADGSGSLITVGGDSRITRIGRMLRLFKIDELPQFFNVITGDMTIVGPRPEVGRYVRLYTEEQRAILAFRPGITDPASLAYRRESEMLAATPRPERLYTERIMGEKIAISLRYARTSSVGSDLKVIIGTVRGILGK